MTNRCFLSTYKPLVRTAAGRQAIRLHGLPPFVDGSCRREPDLESSFPSITAICHCGHFAPRLDVGNRVAYLTVKGAYEDDKDTGWRVVAFLEVIERCESHEDAARWYCDRGLPLPSNCLVPGNQPLALDRTSRGPRSAQCARCDAWRPARGCGGGCDDDRRAYEAKCRRRARKWPVFLITQARFLDLVDPPQVTERDLQSIFGGVPGTQTPPKISGHEFSRLFRLAVGDDRRRGVA
jgi:hypothetical protein